MSAQMLLNHGPQCVVWHKVDVRQLDVGHGGEVAFFEPLDDGCLLVRVPVGSQNRVLHHLLRVKIRVRVSMGKTRPCSTNKVEPQMASGKWLVSNLSPPNRVKHSILFYCPQVS